MEVLRKILVFFSSWELVRQIASIPSSSVYLESTLDCDKQLNSLIATDISQWH